MNFHLTQFFYGHGCFGNYLFRFQKLDNPKCVDCQAPLDDAEHAFFKCDRWWWQRRELEVKLIGDFTPDAVGKLMLSSHNNWKAIDQYVNLVLSIRERGSVRDNQKKCKKIS